MKVQLPYIGPRPFDSRDQAIFFGRDREAYELMLQVISKKEVVLYSLSGAGKTSLVNAKVCPMLEKEGFEILPPARVQGATPAVQAANVFVFHTLMSWIVNGMDAEEVSRLSLQEFLSNHPRSMDEEGTGKPRLIIFDQFEELFTSQPDRWRERQGFFQQMRDVLDADPTARALFIMRADCIGRLDRYAQILPQKFRARFYLEQLREDSALAAITGPAAYFGCRFAPGVAEKIVADLMQDQGEFVESIQLQIVCANLWRDLPQDSVEITMEHLRYADVGSALLNFYEDALRTVAGEDRAKSSRLRRWIEDELITSAGTRSMVFRGQDKTAGLPNEIIDALEEVRLIRSELRSGGRWYELAHDGFVDAIRKSRQKWWAGREAAKQILDRLEGNAKVWDAAGRPETGLLTGTELLDLVRLRDSSDTFQMEFSGNLRTLLDKSERQQAKDETERLRKLLLLSRLIAQADAHKQDDLDLALLLSLEANRIADVIKQTGGLSEEFADRLVIEARASLGATLVVSPCVLKFLRGHSKTVSSVAFDGTGHLLATGSHDGTVILWSAWGYPISPPLVGHKGRVEAVAVSPDGETLASCGRDGKVVLWDVASLKPIDPPLMLAKGPFSTSLSARVASNLYRAGKTAR
jgi:WD domain, G-beta repeat